MGLRPITWGMGWGDVPRPAGSDAQAPFDVALLAIFDRRPVLTAGELLGLVEAKFAEAGAPADRARVEAWLANAEARNLVERRSGAWVITQRGERRLRAVRFAGLTLGAAAGLLFVLIVGLLVLAVVTMSRRDRRPLELRRQELAAAAAAQARDVTDAA